jgi:predicted PurR-regulated permease PerM
MTKKEKTSEKPKTRWGCIIGILIIVLILAGGGYLFYSIIYPQILQKNQTQTTYSLPTINKEGKDRIQNNKDYGQPIQDNEPAGRADPFAPI